MEDEEGLKSRENGKIRISKNNDCINSLGRRNYLKKKKSTKVKRYSTNSLIIFFSVSATDGRGKGRSQITCTRLRIT